MTDDPRSNAEDPTQYEGDASGAAPFDANYTNEQGEAVHIIPEDDSYYTWETPINDDGTRGEPGEGTWVDPQQEGSPPEDFGPGYEWGYSKNNDGAGSETYIPPGGSYTYQGAPDPPLQGDLWYDPIDIVSGAGPELAAEKGLAEVAGGVAKDLGQNYVWDQIKNSEVVDEDELPTQPDPLDAGVGDGGDAGVGDGGDAGLEF